MRLGLAYCQRVLLTLLLFWSVSPAHAAEAELRPLVQALAGQSYTETIQAVEMIGERAQSALAPVLEQLAAGELYVRKADGRVVSGIRDGRSILLSDPITGGSLGSATRREAQKIRVNNAVRRAVRRAITNLSVRSPDPDIRAAAAKQLFESRDLESRDLLERALADEDQPEIADLQRQALAALTLIDEASAPDALIEAASIVAARGDLAAQAALRSATASDDPRVQAAYTAAAEHVENRLMLWGAARDVWFGLSLASVLFLAASGLAITFGLMGVINMAHGELVMLGAYTTYSVQVGLEAFAPSLVPFSLVFAAPAGFLVSGCVGIAIERGIVRHLYDRPLETLLATFGVSLILQQAVRSIFGAANLRVENPDWMAGAFEVGQLTVTYNRLWILVFAAIMLVFLYQLLNRTRFGLEVRAVTQNRQMAANLGIRTDRVDALTFGLGAGLAGLAGVALSQIGNVSPNLGQAYIIDSFMVVVLGGVGNIWGTLAGSGFLGIFNKLLEPQVGAVVAKVLVLVLVIIFIQLRPRGLFALKGRAVD